MGVTNDKAWGILSMMSNEEKIERQKQERSEILDAILASESPKKMIVAGAGTGKTFTFGQVLKLNAGGNNIAMTFIRILTKDMEQNLSEYSDVYTFHAYCKYVLHKHFGGFELVPYLTKLIQRDAEILEYSLSDFDSKFRMLDEESAEIAFYLKRGDYYGVFSFNDVVYRLLKKLQSGEHGLPSFKQIVIDEFQDFCPLEVAFINELEKMGNILIVGDDDQAIYDNRDSSPFHLREKHASGEYEVFSLPFCSRCPEAVVEATNAFIDNAHANNLLQGRITKRYECFLDAKKVENERYPKIITLQCTLANVACDYIASEISKIDPEEIQESHDGEYPTVLVIGQKQYLRKVYEKLSAIYPHIQWKPSESDDYKLSDGYEFLMNDEKSNLGWRILIEYLLDEKSIEDAIAQSLTGTSMSDILDADFVSKHQRAMVIFGKVKAGEEMTTELLAELKEITGDHFEELYAYFSKKEEEVSEIEVDTAQPTILLTSYKGCKGLSAGHVFIVGANDGEMPRNPSRITDVEASQFLVALTRTRKQCHVISNKWYSSPKAPSGEWNTKYPRSTFMSWLPSELCNDLGELKASDLR